ncbi:hypothetical protein FB451DRAFT_1179047 [Mycena latifolia]|nr:hypothetical protein FB451DRAFT_1179047 [Mycena latifolia]
MPLPLLLPPLIAVLLPPLMLPSVVGTVARGRRAAVPGAGRISTRRLRGASALLVRRAAGGRGVRVLLRAIPVLRGGRLRVHERCDVRLRLQCGGANAVGRREGMQEENKVTPLFRLDARTQSRGRERAALVRERLGARVRALEDATFVAELDINYQCTRKITHAVEGESR